MVVMPRAGQLPAHERVSIEGLSYSPTHLALGWRRDSLVVGHVESYAYGERAAATCTGTGLFVVGLLEGGAATPLRTGAPVCDAAWAGSVALTADAGTVVYATAPAVNASRVVRMRLADGAIDTISRRCAPMAEEPALTPDGRAIAIRGLCGGRGQREWGVYVGPFGIDQWRRIVGGDSISAVQPSWSPDGTALVVRLGRQRDSAAARRLAVVGAAAGAVRPLVHGSAPSWSPDGAWIAYVHTNATTGEDNEIRLIRPDGTAMRTLFRNETRTTYVRGFGAQREGSVRPPLLWTTDSRGIVFGRAFDRGVLLWYLEIAPDGAQLRQVTEATQR